MAPEAATGTPEDLEHLRRRFEEFRNTRAGRSPLPDALLTPAAELAKRYGVNRTARALRLEYAGLRKRTQAQDQPKPKRKHAAAPPPNFLDVGIGKCWIAALRHGSTSQYGATYHGCS